MRAKVAAALLAAALLVAGCSPAVADAPANARATAPEPAKAAIGDAVANGETQARQALPAEQPDAASAQAAQVAQAIPGTYGYCEDDGEGHVFVDIWRLDEDGTAARMGRMCKWDYTWQLAGGRDALGRPVVLLEPAAGNPVREPRELAYDEGIGALCEPGEPEARYTR